MTYDTEPAFIIEHQIDIAAPPNEVWRVLADTASYAEWNPYLLAIEGRLAPDEQLRVTIAQDNWDDTLIVTPTVMRAEPGHVLHWRGSLGEIGILDTDHVFEIQQLSESSIRFRQYEEFRGSVSSSIDAEQQEFTRRAFQAMNTALATRALS